MIVALKKRVQAKPALTALTLITVGVALVLGLSFVWQQRQNADGASAFDAVKVAKSFDPGNIMSDAVMSNKNSMSQSQIQSFLNSKNRCKTNPQSPSVLTSINKAKTEGTYKYGGTTYKYHLNNGKFVCLADQKFNGETAAKIIYNAAQSYSINPQVLLVFLEKEQGLISDNWPNYNFQYQTAMGFGCPDSGPNNSANCNSKYFGFKNQIRQAAELLREVLDGGWTNYPLGNNNILYNPNPSCGTQKVNIKNLATSALYRYTPYVPNKGALAAGYGTASCGAYGNRNVFLFFNQWFGSTQEDYTPLKEPRWMQLKDSVSKYTPLGAPAGQLWPKGMQIYFPTKVTVNGTMYLRTQHDTDKTISLGFKYSDLEEVPMKYTSLVNPRWLEVKHNTYKVDPRTGKKTQNGISAGTQIYFPDKIPLGEVEYLRTQHDSDRGLETGIPYTSLKNTELAYENLKHPRWLEAKKDISEIDITGASATTKNLNSGEQLYFNYKITVNDVVYISATKPASGKFTGYRLEDFNELSMSYTSLLYPREFTTASDVRWIDPVTEEYENGIIPAGTKLFYQSKITIGGVLYLRTNENTKNKISRALDARKLHAVYVPLKQPRQLATTRPLHKVDLTTGESTGSIVAAGTKLYFTTKSYIGDTMYLRTDKDTGNSKNVGIKYDLLAEVR